MCNVFSDIPTDKPFYNFVDGNHKLAVMIIMELGWLYIVVLMASLD